jgi:putative intracellular protease/amidase
VDTEDATPLEIGVILVSGFQALDVFGPLDALNALSRARPLRLEILSHDLSLVSTRDPESPHSIEQLLKPTATFASRPALDILLVPGGPGTRMEHSEAIEGAISFIRDVYPNLKFLLTVCTGAVLAAWAGVLDGSARRRISEGLKWFLWRRRMFSEYVKRGGCRMGRSGRLRASARGLI